MNAGEGMPVFLLHGGADAFAWGGPLAAGSPRSFNLLQFSDYCISGAGPKIASNLRAVRQYIELVKSCIRVYLHFESGKTGSLLRFQIPH